MQNFQTASCIIFNGPTFFRWANEKQKMKYISEIHIEFLL